MNTQHIISGLVGIVIGVLIMLVVSGGSQHGPGMTMTMDGMMSGLSGKTGDEFDKAFIREMIVHHEGAVAMAKQVLATSKRPELVKLADDIIKAQTSEIEQMRAWDTLWFGK